MHRLVIVSGPNRGSSFSLIEGENSIGRQMDNHIVLTSSKVSKRHCALLVTSSEVLMRDEGSTNGTFVNGAMAKRQPLKPGDKLGVGEFVMELVKAGGSATTDLPATLAPSNVIPMANYTSAPMVQVPEPTFQPVDNTQVMPEDLPGKIKFGFENKIMPQFYGMLMKSEYRSIVAGMFCVLVAVSVLASVLPIQDLAEQSIKREAMIRAKVLCRELADRYSPFIAGHSESQIDMSMMEHEESVKLAVITNLNMQIIAPQARLNQILAGGREAIYAMSAARQFREGRERGLGGFVDERTAVWAEPIKTTDPRLMRTDVSAMVVVAIDFSSNLLDGQLDVSYATAAVISGLIAAIVFFILMRLTMKPFEVLNDDLDQVLRGEITRVTNEFKIEELKALWDNINSAAQRLPKGGGDSFGDSEMVNWEQEFAPMRALADTAQCGLVAFDAAQVVMVINAKFEEMSGIRAESVGQALSTVARDQAFVSLVNDLKEKSQMSVSRSTTDDFEFTGVAYQVVGVTVGPPSQQGLAVLFRKKE